MWRNRQLDHIDVVALNAVNRLIVDFFDLELAEVNVGLVSTSASDQSQLSDAFNAVVKLVVRRRWDRLYPVKSRVRRA
jgi:hypothetical protein